MNVDRSLGFDQTEMDVEAVGEGNGRAVTDVGFDVVLVDVGLQFVRGRHHHQVGPAGGFGHAHHLEAIRLGLLGGCRAFAQRHGDVARARILEVERVRPALRTVADDGHLLRLDEIEIGVAIIIYAHETLPLVRVVFVGRLRDLKSPPPPPEVRVHPRPYSLRNFVTA
jgi:hypothetical protein